MQDFEEIIINNWATRFQCSVSTIRQNGTTLLPDEKYANQNLVILWHIGKHSFALFDPSDTALLRDIIVRLPINTSLSGDNIQQVLGINAISSHDIDLIHYLSPSDLPNLATPHSFHVRELALSDQEYLSALRTNCTREEVSNGYVDMDHEIMFGCFHDHELVSAASGYRMAGFMNIAVLTHTKFRKLGLGKVVVGALCKWAVVHNIIAQYRGNTHNTGSLGVARSLNFRHYFSSESIVSRPTMPALDGWDPQRSRAWGGRSHLLRSSDRCSRSGLLPRPICAFSGTLRGLKLVPSKWRYLVPPMLCDGYPTREEHLGGATQTQAVRRPGDHRKLERTYPVASGAGHLEPALSARNSGSVSKKNGDADANRWTIKLGNRLCFC